MGTLQELRLRLSFLQQTIGEIVQQFRHLKLTSEEISDCLNILDNTKASISLFERQMKLHPKGMETKIQRFDYRVKLKWFWKS